MTLFQNQTHIARRVVAESGVRVREGDNEIRAEGGSLHLLPQVLSPTGTMIRMHRFFLVQGNTILITISIQTPTRSVEHRDKK